MSSSQLPVITTIMSYGSVSNIRDQRLDAPPLRVLLVGNDRDTRDLLSTWLTAEGHNVVTHGSLSDAGNETVKKLFDAVFLDFRPAPEAGMDFIGRLRAENCWTKVVIIANSVFADQVIGPAGMESIDYLPHPFTRGQVQLLLRGLANRIQLERRAEALQTAINGSDSELFTCNPAMLEMLELARTLASTNANVLICGEVGAGKRRLARLIHAWSRRSQAPLVTVNCQSRSTERLEAELFGQLVPEATGPPRHVPGRVELCEGGTLLLYELADMPPSLQPKLLQLIRSREYERLDDFRLRQADVRIIATSSADLQAQVRQRRFREDLQLVMEVAKVMIPPLRHRPEDIRPLARRFLSILALENRRPITGFSSEALRALEGYSWPGNVRELRNIVERAVLLCASERIELEHLPPNLLRSASRYAIGDLVPLKTIQELHILRVASLAGSLRRAAEILGLSERALSRLMKPHAD